MIRTHYSGEPWKPWVAWDDEATEGDDPMGRGQSKAEAIADLKQWLAELAETETILDKSERSKS